MFLLLLFLLTLSSATADLTINPSKVTQLSWHPRAFLYKGFLSDEDCDHLITLARDKLVKSMVGDNESGGSIMSTGRTSSGMFLAMAQDEIVARIERKIAAWTFLPEENGEEMQILHYENGEKYESHFDYFYDKSNLRLGGHRIATVLMYLSNVIKGGETIFPAAEEKISQIKDDTWSDCAKKGYADCGHLRSFDVFVGVNMILLGKNHAVPDKTLYFSVKPEKGDAMLFYNLHPDATTDSYSLHESCPVIEGDKWAATKWIHVRSSTLPEEGECVDENDYCSQWAAAGECEKNPIYMVGSNKSSSGFCRKSCRVCVS